MTRVCCCEASSPHALLGHRSHSLPPAVSHIIVQQMSSPEALLLLLLPCSKDSSASVIMSKVNSFPLSVAYSVIFVIVQKVDGIRQYEQK